MDNPPRPEDEYINPGCYIPAADGSSPTIYDETYEAAFQTSKQDFKYLMNKETNRNASMSFSDGSARTNQAMPATCNRYENTSSSKNSLGSFLSSSLDVSREFDISVETRNHSVPYGTATVSSVPTHNWNRNVSNNRMTIEIYKAHERTRYEIRGKSGKGLSTDSKQKSMYYYNALEINTKCQTSSHRSRLAGIDRKIQNNNHQTVSHNPRNLLLIKRSCPLGQNIASNANITDISLSNVSSDVSDSIPFKIESIRSADNIAVPGPSAFNRNVYPTKISGDSFQPCFQSKIPSIKRNEGKALICNVCRSEIFKHSYKDGRKFRYNCCICIYSCSEKGDLQMHSDTHLPKKSCNVCQKEHTEGNSHDGEHTCAACKETFHCKAELNEHILEHIDYFYVHCWVCSKNFNDHFIEEESVDEYVCCICPFKGKYRSNLRRHAEMHRPKLFCTICKEEYQMEQKNFHGSEFTCQLCKETFRCQTMLEDHTKGHQKYFDSYCRVCNKIIEDDHKIKTDKIIFCCCKCFETFTYKFELQNHLYTHTDLSLFKCDTCGGRFKEINGLKAHLRFCPAVPYKCGSCPAKFPRKDFLDLHCSVKHKMV